MRAQVVQYEQLRRQDVSGGCASPSCPSWLGRDCEEVVGVDQLCDAGVLGHDGQAVYVHSLRMRQPVISVAAGSVLVRPRRRRPASCPGRLGRFAPHLSPAFPSSAAGWHSIPRRSGRCCRRGSTRQTTGEGWSRKPPWRPGIRWSRRWRRPLA